MQKERFEWVRSWCDNTTETKLPRVLLVGDSITEGYEATVRDRLKGICYVDYLATSYAVDSKMYNTLVRGIVEDSDYEIVHFNHGLHGKHMSKRTYESKLFQLLKFIEARSNVILATSTHINTQNNENVEHEWEKKIKERNEVILTYAAERGLIVDDLYTVSVQMAVEKRASDGVHYFDQGYRELASHVIESISKQLKQI